MNARYEHTDEFKGALFESVDLSGAVIRASDLTGLKISGSDIAGVRLSGHAGDLEGVRVNDVDVTSFVNAELDRRYPERVMLHAVRSLAGYRALWMFLEERWDETIARAERLPEAALHERVDGEWSFVETLRHLVFAIDVWIGRMIRGEPRPFHRLGLPPDFYPADGAAEIGIDLEARPSLEEVKAVRTDRMAQVRAALGEVTEAGFEEVRTGRPAPAWDTDSRPVRRCFHVVFNEHCEHRRYVVRDLAVIEAR
jgi:hypothetical protein